MKKRSGKMSLNRETVRLLTLVEPSLQRANGGTSVCLTDSCPTACYACEPAPSQWNADSWCVCA